ncbi:PREDICTED: filaggrin-2-like [Camelina sativa]|uniref:Filaggrin-2-like n=1 Tax=Camelina sativa TaxID=90675 RepID=A0ABM0TSH2_CAMSA|nr:PREDICTED: filaggrin-2-like [Camelina sativa]
MQYYENREKDYYEVAQGQRNGYGQSQSHGQKPARPVYGLSPTLNHRSHGGFLDGLFKGQTGQKSQSGLGTFLGQHKTHETNKGHGHGKLLGQHQKKTHETNKGLNGLGMFINNGEKKHRRQSEPKKKNSKDGHGSGDESGSSSGSDSD